MNLSWSFGNCLLKDKCLILHFYLSSDFTTLNLNPLHTGTCTVQLFMNFVVHRWLEMCLASKESVSKPDVILLLVILEPPTNIGAV